MRSIRSCAHCGKPIPAHRSPLARYCSLQCRSQAQHLRAGNRTADIVSRNTRGAINELKVCTELMQKGWRVYRAMGPHALYDLIAVKQAMMIRIEVKTGSYDTKGRPQMHCRVEQQAACDIVAYVFTDNRIIYVPDFPVSDDLSASFGDTRS